MTRNSSNKAESHISHSTESNRNSKAKPEQLPSFSIIFTATCLSLLKGWDQTVIRRVIRLATTSENIQIYIVYSNGNHFSKGAFLVHADTITKVHLSIKKTKISCIKSENILYTLLFFLERKTPTYHPSGIYVCY